MLCVIYENGNAGVTDFEKATAFLKTSAESGYSEAQFVLGAKLYGGSNNPNFKRDSAEAIKWFTKAAEQGHARGCHLIGQIHETGSAGKKDYATAIKWYKKALALEFSSEAKLMLKMSIRRCEVYLTKPDNPQQALYQDPEFAKMMKQMMQEQMIRESAEQEDAPLQSDRARPD